MDIFFSEPDETPLPPDEVRIRELRAEPYSDGRRVNVYLEVDPFQSNQRPNADFLVTDAQGEEVASTSVIGSISRKMELTLHLRNKEKQGGRLSLHATLFYASINEDPDSDRQVELPERTVIDSAQVSFDLPTGKPD
jgi:hypothetical protein